MYQIKKSNYLYVLPALLIIVVFVLYPVLFNIVNSFFEWQGLRQDEAVFVGLQNYKQLIGDPVTPIIFKNTFIFFIITSVVQLGGGFILAYIFARGIKGGVLMRTILFIPVITSYVVMGTAFRRILDMGSGEISQILDFLGLDKIITVNWLGDYTAALYTIIFISIWKWIGYDMILYYSSMMAIPSDIIEAATIDGANSSQVLTRIVFPMMRGTHYTCLILNSIGVLKVFDHVYVLTGGGPGRATQFFSTYIYLQANDLFHQGYASAYGTILFGLALIITIIQLRMYSKNRV